MIRCRLSTLMGERHILKLSDVVRETGVNRNTLTSMYYDRAVRIELPVADKLCTYFNCNMHDLFEYFPDDKKE
ncbi:MULTISPECIES: helix-turn-helix domain-containing protein [Acinetobacter]|uniref:Putative transcriptional regulator n=1 Tax=Acinetobacter boissieri TaxID=1219383 RepID=A0A1G6JPQ0_9GAMM|nr:MULTISPECIES: helix-turn-helix transcriptional regulator [Acinetobacter]MCF9047441.1 helix-turn-helix transcriptional regulator [Acinetobacter nectaris]SDC20667.1 putative transcriptional regulator [Acinetobacter boissieri]